MKKILLGIVVILIGISAPASHPASALQATPPAEASASVPLPSYRGMISVTKNGRYFQDEDGQGFLVIGQNDAVSWPGLGTLVDRLSPDSTEKYIVDLRAHGVTVSRVMIEYAQYQSNYLENPVGTFSPSMVQFWDDFIRLAEKHGLYLLLTPYDTFWQAKHWGSYPYNAALGGPCKTPRDWLTAPDCIAAQKTRWDFILKRWGNSPNIFAWDLMNEIDLWWGASAGQIDAYVTDMAAYIRKTEQAAWGRTRLITASSAAAIPVGTLAGIIYNHPALDFANTHLYVGSGVKAPKDAVELVPEIVGAVKLSLDAIKTPRPYFDSESGPIDHWIVDAALDAEYHHNLSWAHLASCGSGSGMRWPYTNPHWILPSMRDNLLGMTRFTATVDWTHFDSHNVTLKTRVSQPNVYKTGCADSDTAILWLLRDTRQPNAPLFDGVDVELSETLADGAYVAEVWDTHAGRILQTVTVNATNGTLSIPLRAIDPGLKSVAIKIQPQPHS